MKVWLRQHVFALKGAIPRPGRGFGSFAFNVLVVAIALALPFAGLTVLENMRPVSAQLAVEPEISVFLSMDTPRARASALPLLFGKAVQSHLAGERRGLQLACGLQIRAFPAHDPSPGRRRPWV